MLQIFWADGKSPCHEVWIEDRYAALQIAQALKKSGKYKVVFVKLHLTDESKVEEGFEEDYNNYLKWRDGNY